MAEHEACADWRFLALPIKDPDKKAAQQADLVSAASVGAKIRSLPRRLGCGARIPSEILIGS